MDSAVLQRFLETVRWVENKRAQPIAAGKGEFALDTLFRSPELRGHTVAWRDYLDKYPNDDPSWRLFDHNETGPMVEHVAASRSQLVTGEFEGFDFWCAAARGRFLWYEPEVNLHNGWSQWLTIGFCD